MCHSLHLVASKATEELPSSLDFLCREIHNWFSSSSLRQLQYKDIFDTINVGEGKKLHKFQRLSTTRWLSRYEAMKNILDQWTELAAHFNIVGLKEKCYMCRVLKEMLYDEANKAYFIFLKPILHQINHLNLCFQKENLDVGCVHELVYVQFLSFAKRVLKPVFLNKTVNREFYAQIIEATDNPLAVLNSDSIDYGVEFEEFLEKISSLSRYKIKHQREM